MTFVIEGGRRRGRPKRTWKEVVEGIWRLVFNFVVNVIIIIILIIDNEAYR